MTDSDDFKSLCEFREEFKRLMSGDVTVEKLRNVLKNISLPELSELTDKQLLLQKTRILNDVKNNIRQKLGEKLYALLH